MFITGAADSFVQDASINTLMATAAGSLRFKRNFIDLNFSAKLPVQNNKGCQATDKEYIQKNRLTGFWFNHIFPAV
jgi:hypothetical protein